MQGLSGWRLLTLGLALGAADLGCNSLACGRHEYPDWNGLCSVADHDIVLTSEPARVNLRPDENTGEKQGLRLKVSVRRKGTQDDLLLAADPKVELAQDGGPLQSVQIRVQDDRLSVEVLREPEQLQLGAVDATVTVADLAAAALTVQKVNDKPILPRIYRKPLFASARSLTLPLGPVAPRSGQVVGRASVQVAGPFGEMGRLLVTESVSTVTGDVRWLELFQQAAASTLSYDMSGVWRNEQLKQQEGSAALLTLGKGAMFIYDKDSMSGRNDLSMLPLLGTRRTRLSGLAQQVPANATGLSAAADEAVVVVAEVNQVHFFGFDTNPLAQPLRYLGVRSVAHAAPVMATRDVAGMVPTVRSLRYFAVVASDQGAAQLIPLSQDAMMRPLLDTDGIREVALPGPVRALALADLDSDGLQDIVYALKSDQAAQDGVLGWAPQHPDGTFPEMLPLGLTIPKVASLSVGDLNGDTVPDLAVATADTQALHGNATVYWNQPN